MTGTVQVHPDIKAALIRWANGDALSMEDVKRLPVRLPDGRQIPFGDCTPDDLSSIATALEAKAQRDLNAIHGEWDAEQ